MLMDTLLPALVAYLIGLVIAWFLWARDGSENA
jgi:hypothetical protein